MKGDVTGVTTQCPDLLDLLVEPGSLAHFKASSQYHELVVGTRERLLGARARSPDLDDVAVLGMAIAGSGFQLVVAGLSPAAAEAVLYEAACEAGMSQAWEEYVTRLGPPQRTFRDLSERLEDAMAQEPAAAHFGE